MENQNEIILYSTPDGKSSVALLARDGMLWLSQAQIAELFATTKQNISLHIINILKDSELLEKSVVKEYLTTASDGKQYNVTFYSLEMILAIGFRVRSIRGVQFRQWANKNLSQYLVKGFVIDNERLKNPDGRPDYYDELLAQIRDIRASEKRFYQKVRDLFTLSSDYDKTDKSTQLFYAETQNKMLYAVTERTAAEIITERANADAPNMGLTSWKGSVVRKEDIYIAKNYLSANEIDSLNRFVTVFLETAELRAKNRQDITMSFWRETVNKILALNDKKILVNAGSISSKNMERAVERVYSAFDTRRKQQDAIAADQQDMAELKEIEVSIQKERK